MSPLKNQDMGRRGAEAALQNLLATEVAVAQTDTDARKARESISELACGGDRTMFAAGASYRE